jgi:hypothetical protein
MENMSTRISQDFSNKGSSLRKYGALADDFKFAYNLEDLHDTYIYRDVCTEAIGNPKPVDRKTWRGHLRTVTHQRRKSF